MSTATQGILQRSKERTVENALHYGQCNNRKGTAVGL